MDKLLDTQYKVKTEQDIAFAFTRTSMNHQGQCMCVCTYNVELQATQMNIFGFNLLIHANSRNQIMCDIISK